LVVGRGLAVTNAKGPASLLLLLFLHATRRSKIAGTIKRDGLAVTQLPAQGRPAKAVLELLRAKEARNIRISSGGVGEWVRLRVFLR
jgi:hypothetical protein